MHRIPRRILQRLTRHTHRRREFFAHLRGATSGERTVVLGLGNPSRGDDAVGLAVAAEVRRLLEQDPVPGVEVRESTRGGLELVDLLAGFTRAVLVDCVDADGVRPGRLRRLDCPQCAGSSRLDGARAAGLAAVLDRAETLGLTMPKPIEILGIEPQDALSACETLSPAVAAVVPRAARAIHAWLRAPSSGFEQCVAACDRAARES